MLSNIRACLSEKTWSVVSAQGNSLKRHLKTLLTAGGLALVPLIGHASPIPAPEVIYQQATEESELFQKSLSPILIKGGKIHFKKSTDDFLEIPYIREKVTADSANTALTVSRGNQCYTTTPHPDDPILGYEASLAYKSLTVNGLLFKTDAFWLMNFHEEAHCGQNLFINGHHADLVFDMLKAATAHKPSKKQVQLLSVSLQETLSDVYASLELQYNYVKNNRASIENGKIPPLNPIIYNLTTFRDMMPSGYNAFKSGNMVADAMIKALENPEPLLMSSKKDRFLSAMLVTAKHLPELGMRSGISQQASSKLSYPKGFLIQDAPSTLETQMTAPSPENPLALMNSQQSQGINAYTYSLLISKENKLLAEPESEDSKLQLHLLKFSQREIIRSENPPQKPVEQHRRQPDFQVNFLDFMSHKKPLESTSTQNEAGEPDANKIPNEIKIEDVFKANIKF